MIGEKFGLTVSYWKPTEGWSRAFVAFIGDYVLIEIADDDKGVYRYQSFDVPITRDLKVDSPVTRQPRLREELPMLYAIDLWNRPETDRH